MLKMKPSGKAEGSWKIRSLLLKAEHGQTYSNPLSKSAFLKRLGRCYLGLGSGLDALWCGFGKGEITVFFLLTLVIRQRLQNKILGFKSTNRLEYNLSFWSFICTDGDHTEDYFITELVVLFSKDCYQP
ncbi:hypothetical protein AV530_006591 [Patagioenas fasciata monilis]|uniref:Uncharacterized protein n=1 Tax=Patagioenas fasciata monilis TaxID=372326 RepID=A0A1V4KH25_PATFA|nr:hypothetical protein AV530_006591 [Patagioenas fasciata monilis]